MSNINDEVNQSYDSQVLAEDIAKGDEKKPKVNVDADYEASKAYSQSEIDQTGEGAKAAEAATASKFEVPEAQETHASAEATADPEAYREMAREVNPQLKQ
ncbi:MAG TPA: hypothetical protein V6C78_22775 [Crinalium sp.]|jgi:hypothetical protein